LFPHEEKIPLDDFFATRFFSILANQAHFTKIWVGVLPGETTALGNRAIISICLARTIAFLREKIFITQNDVRAFYEKITQQTLLELQTPLHLVIFLTKSREQAVVDTTCFLDGQYIFS
jgi:hypothetical protein